jgi:hypothetical protein
MDGKVDLTSEDDTNRHPTDGKEPMAAAASGGAGGALAPELRQLSDPPAFMALARASLALYRSSIRTGTERWGRSGTLGCCCCRTDRPLENRGRRWSCSTATRWPTWSRNWSRCRPGCWPATGPARIPCGWRRPWPAGPGPLPPAWP